eukprot:g11953.t1
MDDVISAAAGYTTSGTANAIAADATASISEAKNTDTEDAPADTAAAAAYPPPPTADATLPTTNANVAPPIASTASSSRGDSSTQPCRVFTIPPDLPLTEDEQSVLSKG